MSETSDVRQVPVDELAHQLVVSLEHADVVLEELAALARIGILTSAPTLPAADKSVELGLGLIRLSYPSDLDRAAADQPDGRVHAALGPALRQPQALHDPHPPACGRHVGRGDGDRQRPPGADRPSRPDHGAGEPHPAAQGPVHRPDHRSYQ